jgi:hypothetical protein
MPYQPWAQSWPDLPYESWQDTRHLLHMGTQMAGKIMLRLNPFINEWWQVAYRLSATGLTTGPIHCQSGAFQIDFDFSAHELQVRTSDNHRRALSLSGQSVASLYAGLMAQLESLEIDVEINTIPDEVQTRTPFEEDEQVRDYDAGAPKRWWNLVLGANDVLGLHRSSFVGKSSPIQFWWGSFDLNYTRFSGKFNSPSPGMSRMMRIAEDQENISAGLWPGNSKLGGPAFYAYAFPTPPGLSESVIPKPGFFDTDLGEFVLRLDDAIASADPDATIVQFLQSTYEACAEMANWDRQALEKPVPALLPVHHHPRRTGD